MRSKILLVGAALIVASAAAVPAWRLMSEARFEKSFHQQLFALTNKGDRDLRTLEPGPDRDAYAVAYVDALLALGRREAAVAPPRGRQFVETFVRITADIRTLVLAGNAARQHRREIADLTLPELVDPATYAEALPKFKQIVAHLRERDAIVNGMRRRHRALIAAAELDPDSRDAIWQMAENFYEAFTAEFHKDPYKADNYERTIALLEFLDGHRANWQLDGQARFLFKRHEDLMEFHRRVSEARGFVNPFLPGKRP